MVGTVLMLFRKSPLYVKTVNKVRAALSGWNLMSESFANALIWTLIPFGLGCPHPTCLTITNQLTFNFHLPVIRSLTTMMLQDTGYDGLVSLLLTILGNLSKISCLVQGRWRTNF